MLQSRYNTRYMKQILSLVSDPKIAIEYGVYKGGTLELLGEYAERIIGVDNYFFLKNHEVDSFVEEWITPRMKDKWTLDICDAEKSSVVNNLDDNSVDIVHYDTGRDSKVTKQVIASVYRKMTEKCIVAFDNLQLTPFSNLRDMLNGYDMLLPFCITVDHERRGKVYCAITEEFVSEYKECMMQYRTELYKGIPCIYPKDGMNYVNNDPKYKKLY